MCNILVMVEMLELCDEKCVFVDSKKETFRSGFTRGSSGLVRLSWDSNLFTKQVALEDEPYKLH